MGMEPLAWRGFFSKSIAIQILQVVLSAHKGLVVLESLIAVAMRMKGLLQGIKYISRFFGVHEEHEMEIGYPTDVKHVLHVGSDILYGSSPSWMSLYKISPDFSSTSLSNFASRETSWASQDFDEQRKVQPPPGVLTDQPFPDLPKIPEKAKPKKAKVKSPSSARSSNSSTSRASYSTALEDVSEMQSEF